MNAIFKKLALPKMKADGFPAALILAMLIASLVAPPGETNLAWANARSCDQAAQNPVIHENVRETLAEAPAEAEFPEAVRDLEVVFPHQTRKFNEKQKTYLVLQMDPSKSDDPIYQKFIENSIEAVIVNGSGGFRHLVLRIGAQVFDFAAVQKGRAGDRFRIPSEGKNVKGVAFIVGKEKIQEVLSAVTAFYAGNNKYNNPPFSSVGGKLVLTTEDTQNRFSSSEKVWIPGKKDFNIDSLRNNRIFQGEIVTITDANGREKTVLQNPDGVQIPVGMGADGLPFVNGFSCASSAVYVLKRFFGIEMFESPSAANLVKKLLEGNNGFAATPDALILYGPELYPAKIPFEVATLIRPVPPAPPVSKVADAPPVNQPSTVPERHGTTAPSARDQVASEVPHASGDTQKPNKPPTPSSWVAKFRERVLNWF